MSQRKFKLTMSQTHGIKVGGSIDIATIEGVNNVARVDTIQETYGMLHIRATAQTSSGSMGFITSRLTDRAVYEKVEEALKSDLKYSMKNIPFIKTSDMITLTAIYGYRGNIIPDDTSYEKYHFHVYVRNVNSNVYSIELRIYGWNTPLFVRVVSCEQITDGIRKFLKQYLTDKNVRDYYKSTKQWWKELQDGVISYPGENLVSLTPQETEKIAESIVEDLT